MNSLPVPSTASSIVRNKALADARSRQKEILLLAKKLNQQPPSYALLELIGKGSFGRVYKGLVVSLATTFLFADSPHRRQLATGDVVAIKIINIDDDISAQRGADAYEDFMKEVNALRIMNETKARNINHVLDAFPMGPFMFMISQYCGGGSVATLMRPTPKGLKETFVIPVLREVAIALQFVHEAGLIHRDIKCANVLITEDGQVQLCDFGVAGIVDSKADKRMTFIGTPNWMAPELWEGKYGKEVDIWAWASLAYEMATGAPPNAGNGMDYTMLGKHLREHLPRLEGDRYSPGLKDIIACCLVEDANARLTAAEIQEHAYLAGTDISHPTSSLVELVKAFKKWEEYGGSRRSLFIMGGASAPEDPSEEDEDDDNDWNFSTTDGFDEGVIDKQDIIDVYGRSVNFEPQWESTERPATAQRSNGRRRPPPEALAPIKAPIEKVFDPNTITSYMQNSRNQYGARAAPQADPTPPKSDLALRDVSAQPPSTRESVIDLGDHDAETGISTFQDVGTMKPSVREGESMAGDFSRPAVSDPADNPNKRATQEWKFPSMAAPASANSGAFRFPPLQQPMITPGAGGRPALRHHPTEPVSIPTLSPPSPTGDRMSLIDLDFGMPDDISATLPTNLSLPEEIQRPSTADSSASNDIPSQHPFHWEAHSSMTPQARGERIPSLLLSSDTSLDSSALDNVNDLDRMLEASDFSTSEVDTADEYEDDVQRVYYDEYPNDFNRQSALPQPLKFPADRTVLGLPELPLPPSEAAMTGTATNEELAEEVRRMLGACNDQLSAFQSLYEPLATQRRSGNTAV